MPRKVLTFLWLFACSIAMLTPGSSFPNVSVFSFQDKFIHFFIFFVLAYLAVGLGVQEKKEIWRSKRLWINFIGIAFFPSIGFETAQHLIPYRSFDLNDLIVNILGIFSGLLGYLFRPSCKFILD
ncbi:MAG: VanZ family protein [Bacteroidetes bacterium]|nr:VanZ family protein [Bacteroidota bacterium]